MPKATDDTDRILDAALELAASARWGSMSLGAVAEAAGIPMSRLYDLYSSRLDVARAVLRRADAAVLQTEHAFDPDDDLRDRLFDVLMARFDALAAHKAAIVGIVDHYSRRPTGLCLVPDLIRSMRWMLEAAGTERRAAGGRGCAETLAVAWLATWRIWREDDTPDMARTMAALDRNLRRWQRMTSGRPAHGGGAADTFAAPQYPA